MSAPEVYSKITEVNKSPTCNRAVLRAFIKTDNAFAEAMRTKIDMKSLGIKEDEAAWKMDVTAIDLPTYKHLPNEFLSFTDNKKKELIRALCLQNTTLPTSKWEKAERSRDEYIRDIVIEAQNLLKNHLHAAMPEKFTHRYVTSVNELIDFMNMEWLRSDNEKLYHCMLLKSIFLVHVIHATVDLESLPQISNAIRKRIQDHENIRELSWDETNGKMQIAYTAPGGQKPKLATITFGEKSLESIFDKLARKAEYSSPDMLNDLARMNIEFEDGDWDDEVRLWLLRELDAIAFGKRRQITIDMSIKEGNPEIISSKLFKNRVGVRNIPDVHNIQVTGKINDNLPQVRWVKSFEVMCTVAWVDWNTEGKGNRKIYKVERLQQAFARLNTGSYGILKPGQVKYALTEYARQEWMTESPEELLHLLVMEKGLLIPVGVLHGQSLCFRIKNTSRPETKNLETLQMQDLDPREVYGRIAKEFKYARTISPKSV